uniref:Uncharacterized protein n=1 Tax=Rousettus aegyptiacus TaxID=9407 RepID=A0A7J8DXE0_ROUAE|nr:hypothetical protein HJG63_008269 [Rousettus aegyptiacus]
MWPSQGAPRAGASGPRTTPSFPPCARPQSQEAPGVPRASLPPGGAAAVTGGWALLAPDRALGQARPPRLGDRGTAAGPPSLPGDHTAPGQRARRPRDRGHGAPDGRGHGAPDGRGHRTLAYGAGPLLLPQLRPRQPVSMLLQRWDPAIVLKSLI